MKTSLYLKKLFISSTFFSVLCLAAITEAQVIEDVIVTAEKRSESVQDISQSVTAITEDDLDAKNINSFVDLSAIVPGVTVAKNEGYKTVISIRGVGNETNQNAIAAPSVAFHMDGIFIASPFSLQTDFIDVERIEVLRGPQGTLFGQNSTGGAINVISKKPSTEGYSNSSDITLGSYAQTKFRSSSNIPLSDKLATRFSFSTNKRDGFSENTVTGQELDDANSLSIRSDWLYELSDVSTLRVFGQYFEIDRNGSAMRGIDDTSGDARRLSQDTISNHDLTSMVVAAIYENDLGFANLKVMASIQDDDISVTRDNDRHNFGDLVGVIPGLGSGATYQRAEFAPETSIVETNTFEINLVSNEPIFGALDWTVGAFYMEHDIENHIRGYRDNNNDGQITYECSSPLAVIGSCYEHDYGIPGRFAVFDAEYDFVTDAFPSRESYSIYAQTTYSFNDDFRLVSGIRYSEDTFTTNVSNFYNVDVFEAAGEVDKVTGKIVGEYDLSDQTMAYWSFSQGFKPGGSNLTYGYTEAEDIIAERPVAPAMVFQTYQSETIEAFEVGIKTVLLDGKARANIAVFTYDYDNLQFQATDPDPYRGGVANIPQSEMNGIEVEFTALLSDSLTMDMNLAFLDSEVTSSYEVLDNVDVYQYFFGEEDLRYGLREDVQGNKLAKSPEFTADINLTYETTLASGNEFSSIVQFIRRGDFEQRVSNNSLVDSIDAYNLFNVTASIDFVSSNTGIDFMLLNIADKDGINSSMTDVFGVAATGLEYIAPRQFMVRFRREF
ncbi:TonB-dependent receptor [Gammaproteobacteria bacterium]|nr:TonB-dependent receptor [Gammaproteobacteria bacterium]MDC3313483.1 TonB-dependent receptor [Gammaproteobacteria bacterium]